MPVCLVFLTAVGEFADPEPEHRAGVEPRSTTPEVQCRQPLKSK
jgi:hypothetical protein